MQDIYAGTFVSLYAIYHAAAMRLNRHARPSALPRHKVERNISHAIFDAENFLQVMAWLAQANRKRDIGRDDFVFSTPFPGYVFLQAVDVLTAGGRLVDLPGRLQAIHASLKTLHELTRFWSSAKAQLKTIQGRLDVLAKIVTGEERGAVRGVYWRLRTPFESLDDSSDDVIYGTSDEVFFKAVERHAECGRIDV